MVTMTASSGWNDYQPIWSEPYKDSNPLLGYSRKIVGYKKVENDPNDWMTAYEQNLKNKAAAQALDKKYGFSSTSTDTSGNYGTGASNSNPSFSWNNEDLWAKAKEMSQTQLDNTLKTMDASSGYRRQELNLNDEIARRQADQQFGFQKKLADDNYAFRDRDRAERERANDEQMERQYQMKRETTASARDAASRAFYGGRDFNRFAARR